MLSDSASLCIFNCFATCTAHHLVNIANDISNKKIGFNSDLNEVSIIYKENKKAEKISKRKKSEIAEIISKKILENFVS